MKRKLSESLDNDLNKITTKLRKELKISPRKQEVISPAMSSLTNAVNKVQISKPTKLTEDEEYEIAMKELRELVKSRVDNHLQQQKSYKDIEREIEEEKLRQNQEKKKREQKEFYKLLYGDSNDEEIK